MGMSGQVCSIVNVLAYTGYGAAVWRVGYEVLIGVGLDRNIASGS